MTEVTFTPAGIGFAWYPFAGASVFPNGFVPVHAIGDIVVDAYPPEIRTIERETLFVPAPLRDELAAYGDQAGLARGEHNWIWSDLLEPYLDTAFDEPAERRTRDRLATVGIGVDETAAIRARVGPLMAAYNFDSGLWDWANLGHHDLLQAMTGALVSPELPDQVGTPADVYRWSMAIAARQR